MNDHEQQRVWTCPRCGAGDAIYTRGCSGCNMRRVVVADTRDAETAHDVRFGPCKCGAWH